MRVCCGFVWVLLLLLAVPRLAQAHHLKCDAEPELIRLAHDVLNREELPRGQEVQDALARVQSDLPNVEIVRANRSQRSRIDAWFELWVSKARGKAVCGVAKSDDQIAVVVGERLAKLRTERQAGDFSVFLLPEVSAAYGFALLRNGTVRHAPIDKGKLTFEDGGEILSVQVVGQTAEGPLPVAQWESKRSGRVDTLEDVDVYQWHQELFRTLHHPHDLQRSARRNRKLELAAENYGSTICMEGRVSHLADGSNALQRVAEQGLEARDIGEVLVRAPTLPAALGALLRSASHRLVLLDERMTDVGFGIHRTDNEVCVVGLFASWPRPVSMGAGARLRP